MRMHAPKLRYISRIARRHRAAPGYLVRVPIDRWDQQLKMKFNDADCGSRALALEKAVRWRDRQVRKHARRLPHTLFFKTPFANKRSGLPVGITVQRERGANGKLRPIGYRVAACGSFTLFRWKACGGKAAALKRARAWRERKTRQALAARVRKLAA